MNIKIIPNKPEPGFDVFEIREGLFCLYDPIEGLWSRYYPDRHSKENKIVKIYKDLTEDLALFFITSDGKLWYLDPCCKIHAFPSSVNIGIFDLKSTTQYEFEPYIFSPYTFGEIVSKVLVEELEKEINTESIKTVSMTHRDLLKNTDGERYRFKDGVFEAIDFNWFKRIKFLIINSFFFPLTIKEIEEGDRVLVFGKERDYAFVYRGGLFITAKDFFNGG